MYYGRGQIYSDGSNSNNNVYNAIVAGGYEMTIVDALDGRQVVDIIRSGPELFILEGESIKLRILVRGMHK
ncbi:hypothetical protein UlMin_045565 [Ulmus minor]